MIKSKRREYFACHLTIENREKLKAEAKSRGMSMSALAALFITSGLFATGRVSEPAEEDVPLPFSEEL